MTILVLERYYMIMNLLFGLTFLLLNLAHCFNPKNLNISAAAGVSDWSLAGATWYGSPTGYGSDGGACGYGDAVAQSPFSAMVSAGGASLFKSGKGCSACYQIKCTSKQACSKNPVVVVITDQCPGCVTESVHFDLSGTAFGAMAISGQDSQLRDSGVLQILYRNGNPACSGRPITVTITDECPGGPCASEPTHFDLSGKAIGALAKPGQAYRLRAAGVLRVGYRHAPCLYKGTNIAFRIDAGANPYYMSFVVEYQNGDGDLASIEIQPAGGRFISMQEMRSAVWKVNSGSPLRGPFNIRLTSRESRKVIVAQAVIPANWKAGVTYRSIVNF